MAATRSPRPLVPPSVARIRPYVPGRSEEEIRRAYGLERVIKLASNECPLGPCPGAIEAISRTAASCHRYPSVDNSLLRRALAERFFVREANVMPGSGSESIMACIVRAFLLDDDEVITAAGTFLGFEVIVQSRGVRVHRVPLDEHFRFDLDGMLERLNDHTKLIYVANPNNPTGTYVKREAFERFIEQVPKHVLVIWDEAYFEYAQDAPDYPDSMSYRLDNVITLRTFSKAHGLAGLRLGYGLAHEELITSIRKVRLPFEPSSVALVSGLASLADHARLREVLELNAEERPRLAAGLRELGLWPIEAVANFLMVPLGSAERVSALSEALLRRGLIIRPLGPFGFPDAVRITTGTTEEVTTLLENMAEVLEELRTEGW